MSGARSPAPRPAGEVLTAVLERPSVRLGILLAGVIFTSVYLVDALWTGPVAWGADAHDYWATPLDTLYAGYRVGDLSYAYSPAFAELFVPLTRLPFPVYRVAWLALALGALAWLLIPVPRRWRPAIALLCLPDAINGNIHLLLAVALSLGFRYPAAWSAILLTKVTPGVGLLWFAVRREWRALVVAMFATAAVVAVSFVVRPDLWPAWLQTLWANRDTSGVVALSVPLVVRLPVAAVVVGWGAVTGRAWTVPVAATIAVPHLSVQSFVLLAAVPRLRTVSLAPATPYGAAWRDRGRASPPAQGSSTVAPRDA